MTEDLDVSIGTCKKIWIQDVQSTIVDERRYQNLNLFRDADGLLRCRVRLENAEVTDNVKYLYLLIKEHRFTKLVVIYSHDLVLHNGLRETLTQLCSKYWVVKARSVIKKVLRNCIVCRKHEGQSYKFIPEPPLPRKRVACERAFSYCGIDYTGPVFIKNIYGSDNQLYKSWISLVTCASSRAIFLDLVIDSSGPACINMLNRFLIHLVLQNDLFQIMGELLSVRKLSCLLKIETLNGHLTNRLHHGQVDFLKGSPSLQNNV